MQEQYNDARPLEQSSRLDLGQGVVTLWNEEFMKFKMYEILQYEWNLSPIHLAPLCKNKHSPKFDTHSNFMVLSNWSWKFGIYSWDLDTQDTNVVGSFPIFVARYVIGRIVMFVGGSQRLGCFKLKDGQAFLIKRLTQYCIQLIYISILCFLKVNHIKEFKYYLI